MKGGGAITCKTYIILLLSFDNICQIKDLCIIRPSSIQILVQTKKDVTKARK